MVVKPTRRVPNMQPSTPTTPTSTPVVPTANITPPVVKPTRRVPIPKPVTPVQPTVQKPVARTPQPSAPNTFGDLGGATNITTQPINFQQQTFEAPSQFTFGQGATQLEQQQSGYLTQRNNFLAQDLLTQGLQDSGSIFEALSEQYGEFANADMTDRQNTARAIANRIAEMQRETEQQGQQETIEEYRARVQQEAQAAAGQAQQDMMQDRQRAGVVGQDRPLEDLERQKTLQQQSIDRSLEQTRFSVNNQIENVEQEAQRNLDMGDKIGALKGFNRSGGYIAGLQNIRNDADKAISRLQQQLAFAEQYAGEDKAQIIDDFNRSVSRVHEDFAYQTRALRENATINLKEISSKYGLSEEKMAIELEKVAFSFSQQAEELVGQYIANTRNAIQVTNDQIDVLANYDRYLEQQTERFTNIINMDDGAALSTMTRNDIDTASRDGKLLPEQAQAYKQLMVGKAVNTLSSMGIPTQEDVRNLMTQIQGGISPAAALMQIIGNNPDRFTPMQDNFMTVGANSMVFDRETGQFITPPSQGGSTNQNYQGPVIQPAQPEKLQESFRKYANMADGSKVRGGQCGEFVNDYLKEMGVAMKFVDPIDVRITQTNSETPTKGSVVVMTSNSSDLAAKYGHVGIVTNVNADGSFTIKDQNGKNKLAVGTMTIPAGDPRVKGFFDPRLGLGGQSEQENVLDRSWEFNKITTAQINKLSPEDRQDYDTWRGIKQSTMRDMNADPVDLMRLSDGGGQVGDSFMNSYDKMGTVIYQLGDLQEAITKGDPNYFKQSTYIDDKGNVVENKDMNVNLFNRAIKALKKRDKTDASIDQANAIIQGLIPNLARGVFGEVGVLTDADIENYRKTIMTANSPEEVQRVVQAATLQTVMRSLEKKLVTQARGGKNVAGYEGDYLLLKEQVNELWAGLGQAPINNTTNTTTTQNTTPTRQRADDLLNSFGR